MDKDIPELIRRTHDDDSDDKDEDGDPGESPTQKTRSRHASRQPYHLSVNRLG